jgi:PncC family amidohydrolase
MYNEQDIRKNYEKLTKLLIEKNMTITTMESCTSGQLASLITDVEGASAVLKGAFVTYCNEAKIMQGVPEEIIEEYSVYSKETACAMADACRKAYNADIGVGVTGTMGNVDPENASTSVPGQVWFAFSLKEKTIPFFIELSPQPTRFEYKMAVAKEVANELLNLI